MKLLVNCDQVFDVLTRGPFPTGEASDEAVEQHLRACHDCRRLAEALRPAVALMHEAVSGDQALSLPEYQGSLPVRSPGDDVFAARLRSESGGGLREDSGGGLREDSAGGMHPWPSASGGWIPAHSPFPSLALITRSSSTACASWRLRCWSWPWARWPGA